MTDANILVIKLGALGDFIQATGAMRAIRAAHADDNITLMTTKPFVELGRQSGYFNDILLDLRPKLLDLKKWLGLRDLLNSKKFTRVYDLQNNDRTAIYLKLFSPRPEWVGAAPGASHRNTSPERTAGRPFNGHVQTLALGGIRNVEVDPLQWMVGRDNFEGLQTPYVLIVPGASKPHPEKRWPKEYYAALCKKLVERQIQPVLIGSDSESGATAFIHGNVPQSLDLTGKTSLFDLAALARKATGAIGNDTGPMHLIAPTRCKSIVLFSKKSKPDIHAPLGRNVLTLQKDVLDDLPVETVWKAFCDQQVISP